MSILQTEPLEITFAKKPEKTMAENFEIGCPEFLLYHESTSGNWTLKKVEALSVVQAEITKRGYNLKTTARMAVLQKFYDSQEFMIKYTNNILLVLVNRTEITKIPPQCVKYICSEISSS